MVALKSLSQLGHERVKAYAEILTQLKKMRARGDFDADIRKVAAELLGKWGVTDEMTELRPPLESQSLTGHEDHVICIAVAPDCKRAISGALDGNVRVWDSETGKEVYSFDRDIKPIFNVAFAKNGLDFLAASASMLEDGKRKSGLWIWKTGTGHGAGSMMLPSSATR